MLALSHQVGTNLGHLSWIVAARSFGFMISAVFFGVIFQSITKHHSEAMLAIGYLFPAAATALTPHLQSLWTLCLALLFQGMLQGVSDLAINTLVTTMWLDYSTAPLNLVYLGYPIGALLSILVVRAFRSHGFPLETNVNGTRVLRDDQIHSDLIGPYRIVSICCLITSIGFGWIAYKQHQKKKMSNKPAKVRVYQSVAKEEIHIQSKPKRVFNKAKFWKTCSPTTCGQGYLTYGFLIILLLCLYNFFFGGIEQGFTKFFVSFIEQERIDLNPKDAVYAMVFYWVPMLIGRVLCTFLTAVWISPELMLSICLLASLITYMLWIIFIGYMGLTRWIVFLLVTANGLSIASVSPTTIGWIKQFLSLSPIELTFLLSSNAVGGIVFGLISGYVFHSYGSKHLFTVLILLMILCAVFFIFAWFLQSIHANQHKQQQRTIPDKDQSGSFIEQREQVDDPQASITFIDH